ncbi:cell division protein FtsN [Bosea sp. BE125]|uniref:hypothetical protein n=1 Tax=Bosea sp. BE125 TaxID=2817909 RepID=UPI00285C781D|nr:hypothetical protein [Bosea sp. BE125]MDR6871674.1 cell division protein FtsN [Bosea sp. BE125]
MMIINGRATAACLTSLALAGCMGQTIPAAESITKPTMEAFTQLSAWRPWQSKVQEPKVPERPKEEERPQQPQIALVETMPATEPQPTTASSTPSIKRLQPSKPQPAPTRLATPRPAAPQPKLIPASAAETSAPLPTAVSCQTFAQPGQRVRMECNPVN